VRLSLKETARRVLREAEDPLHYREIAKRILEQGLSECRSKTPEASLNAALSVDIKRNGSASDFLRVSPGVFALRGRQSSTGETVAEDQSGGDLQVRIPIYPCYEELRAVLPIWDGRPRKQITGLRATISALRGTPQQAVDWTSPDSWIEERLSGADRELAEAIWKGTSRKVNPRHVYGHWLLATHYGLLREDDDGVMRLTERGKGFLKSRRGKEEAALDEAEGLIKLLGIVADRGSARFGDLVKDWGDFLSRTSKFGTERTIKSTLRRRLRNLVNRELLQRSDRQYSISEKGRAYLRRMGRRIGNGGRDQQDIRALIRQQEASVRESLVEILSKLDPLVFEHLVARLLEEMGYENVEVTSRSGDGGVDVVADIELGITSVREVVRAKRHKQAIQRKDLDALRGSLHRFHAVRGTIITTSRFSKGTREAAFEPGVAPITLIDGEKLVDLLIEHGIGVRKKKLDLLELDAEAFAQLDDSFAEKETNPGAV